jgi:hypothetical protein
MGYTEAQLHSFLLSSLEENYISLCLSEMTYVHKSEELYYVCITEPNSMGQSPSLEVNRFSASQEIPRFYGT